MASGSKRGLTEDELYDLVMNSDSEEDFNINNEGEYSCSKEEWDENIENITSIINRHSNSYIPGSEAVENVASLQSPDIMECGECRSTKEEIKEN
ncbi:hypothetical protein JTB14_008716 [Gonioctena quinquepunctata]|nr:hypothetical protein JTB14_008716 [Gonioctena quinquepunctata]